MKTLVVVAVLMGISVTADAKKKERPPIDKGDIIVCCTPKEPVDQPPSVVR